MIDSKSFLESACFRKTGGRWKLRLPPNNRNIAGDWGPRYEGHLFCQTETPQLSVETAGLVRRFSTHRSARAHCADRLAM
jgi:hypothetical protein